MSNNLKLHTVQGCPYSLMCMGALEKAGLSFEVVVQDKKGLHSKEFKEMNPLQTVPVLQTEQGSVCGSSNVLRWVGRQKNELYGTTPEEQALVDQWMDVLCGDLFPDMQTVNKAMWGVNEVDKKVVKNLVKQSLKNLDFMERQVKDKTYLANDRYTIADVMAANVLDRFFRYVLKPKNRSKLSSLSEYVKRVVAETPLLRPLEFTDQKFNMLKVDVEKKKKEEAEKKKKEAEAKKQQKKAEKPKKPTFPKTKVNFNNLKLKSSEQPQEQKAQYILDNIDLNAFSYFFLEYDKLPGTCKVDYQTKNLLYGLLQRSESFRDHVYGMHCVVGEKGDYNINGVWLWKGTEKLVCLEDNPQFDYYFFTKLDPKKEEDKQLILDYFSLTDKDWGKKQIKGKTIVYHEEYK